MANLEQIFEKVESIDGKVDELLTWKAVVEVQCKAHRQQTDEVRTTIYGDEKNNVGIKTKVQNLLNCKKQITKQRDFWLGVLRNILSYGAVALGAWLLFIYKTVL